MAKYAGRDLVLSIAAPSQSPVTSVASTDIISLSAHGFVAGDDVFFTSLTGGAGLLTGKRYYVIATNLAAGTFMVSTTPGGATVDHTTNITAGAVAPFNTVGQVTSIGMAGSSRDLIDASAYGDAYKDYVVGQQDGNEVEVELALDPVAVAHVALKAAYAAGTSTTFGMTHTAAGFDIAFPAMVTEYSRGAERDGLLTATATLKILNPGVTDTP